MSLTSLEDLTGRHGVIIGQSLINAWNERSGRPIKRSKGYPNPEFYSLRYSFKPESIDPAAPGTVVPQAKTREGHAFEFERPSTKGGVHRFSAVEQRSKDWECVLLWDPETRTFNLERIESTLNLKFEGQGSSSASTVNRKGKAAAVPRPGPAEVGKQEEDEIDAMARALVEELDEDKKENDVLDDLLNDLRPKHEEEVESELDVTQSVQPPTPLPPVQKTKDKPATKVAPKAKAPKAPAKPKPKPKPKAAAPKKAKEKEKEKEKEQEQEQMDLVVENPEIEELSFGHLSRPAKPSYPSAEPATSSGWAFPTLPSSRTPPIRHAQPTPSDLLQPPSTSANHTMHYESDSDPEVMQGEALNEDLFAHEIDMVLAGDDGNEEDEDDFEAVPIEADPATNGRLPTLSELMGGKNTDNSDDDDDDDDDSSSDDTDDD